MAAEMMLGIGACLLVAIALLGGGGQGGLGDVLAQLLALAMLAWLAKRAALGPALDWNAPRSVRWLAALPFALPLLQLLPLGLGNGVARAQLQSQLASVGASMPSTITLNIVGTERALWWLLPAAAIYLTTLVLPRRRQLAVVALVLALAAANVVLGMAQLADGIDSPLRFYSPTNMFAAVGFFANRNHMASLLVMCLPLLVVGTAWAMNERIAGRRVHVAWVVAGFVLLGLFVMGIALTRSRAGVLLGMLAFLCCLPLVLGMRPHRGVRRVLGIGIALALLLSAQFALVGVLQRVGDDPLEDSRWTYARTTLAAATDYAPWGSGLGTFRQAYQPYEAKGEPGRAIVNHAHDDYLELWLEGGVPAMLLLLAGALAWLWRGWQLWRPGSAGEAADDPSRLLLARTAWVAASIALAHSALDYPLRTTANLCVFALLAAVVFSHQRIESASSR